MSALRRLVHLTVNQRNFVDNARVLHFVIEVVPFTCTLTHTCKHRETTVFLGDVVDELHNQNRLTNAGTAEQTDLSAL